jgi:hypothetical protein
MSDYVISPPLDFFPMAIGVAAASPDWATNRLMTGTSQRSQVAPSIIFSSLWDGRSIPSGKQLLIFGVPGITTGDGAFPDNVKPQHRLETVPPPVIVVQFYHGEPGVLRGDDNWSQEVPSIQPQMRTNTIPHTADPTIVDGTWRVNEVFLPSAGA